MTTSNRPKSYFELRRRIQETLLHEYSLEEIGQMMDAKIPWPGWCWDELEELIERFNSQQ